MYKKCFLFILIILIFINLGAESKKKSFAIHTIVIDPGHGGKDPGATQNNLYEKDINLSIAKKLGKYIKKNFPSVKIVFTRENDIFIPLYKRAEIANKAKANLFISIHTNSMVKSTTYGTETYVLGLDKTKDNLRVAMKENAAIFYEEDYSVRYKGFEPNKHESYIIFNLIQNQHLDNSLLLAKFIEEKFLLNAKRNSRGVKQAGFLVLREVSMPSVLIETGFLSNKEEAFFLNSRKGQDYIASSIYRAFVNYKTTMEKTQNIIEKDNEKNNIYYAVQILSLRRKIEFSDDVKNKLPHFKEHFINNTYKYTVGKTKNKKEIDKLRKKLSLTYYKCFVVAILNNKRVSLEKAKKIIKNHE